MRNYGGDFQTWKEIAMGKQCDCNILFLGFHATLGRGKSTLPHKITVCPSMAFACNMGVSDLDGTVIEKADGLTHYGSKPLCMDIGDSTTSRCPRSLCGSLVYVCDGR
jgi:hypothetical protein